MKGISMNIVLLIVLMNVFVGVADAAGMWEDWGVEIQTGVEDEVQDVRDRFNKTGQAGGFGGETLIGMFLFVKDFFEFVFALGFVLPNLLGNLGIPLLGELVNAVVPIIIGRGVIKAFTGR